MSSVLEGKPSFAVTSPARSEGRPEHIWPHMPLARYGPGTFQMAFVHLVSVHVLECCGELSGAAQTRPRVPGRGRASHQDGVGGSWTAPQLFGAQAGWRTWQHPLWR